MAKQSKSAEAQLDEKKRSKANPEMATEPVAGQANLTNISGPIMATGDGSIEAQASQLNDPRLQPVQRQALAMQIGRVQGNRHLQRVVDSLKQDKLLTQTTYTGVTQREMEEEEAEAGPTEGLPVVEEAETAQLEEGEVNEWDEKDGLLTSDTVPHLFVDGRKTGAGELNSEEPLIQTTRTGVTQREMEEEEPGAGPPEGLPVVEEAETAELEEGEVNEWDEKDGLLTSDTVPHVFVNGGKTGSGIVHWVGGNGGVGNQGVGSINVVAPVYESEGPAGALAGAVSGGLMGGAVGAAAGSIFGAVGAVVGGLAGGLIGGVAGGVLGATDNSTAKAWIRPGTGIATVTRSYRGVVVGPNGPTAYFTARASARADAHELLHVSSSQTIHDTHIVPLEQRVAQHTGPANALVAGTTKGEAETALKSFINWNTSIDAFRNADTTANTPMGTVDTADLGAPDFIKNYGPRTEGGVNYTTYYDTPPGPAAAGP